MAESIPATNVGDLVTRVKRSLGNIDTHRKEMAKVAAAARATQQAPTPKSNKA